jgi:hypothetical protein
MRIAVNGILVPAHETIGDCQLLLPGQGFATERIWRATLRPTLASGTRF